MKVALIVLATFILSCENLKYGNIVEKSFSPSHTDMLLIPIMVDKTPVLIPTFYSYSDSWVIEVKGTGSKGHQISKSLWIDEAMFDTVKVGDFICIEGLCDQDTSKHEGK